MSSDVKIAQRLRRALKARQAKLDTAVAREVREDEYRHAYTGRVLRSLLTEGKEA